MAAAMHARELVGRETELARLYQFLDEEPPAARTVVLAGSAGFGKTSLWEAGIDHARERGTSVLIARPSEAESGLSFAALGDLLESVDGAVLASLPAPQQQALEVALLRSAPTERPPEARAIAAGFLGALRVLAARAPLVVAIDDVQWLDAASAAALRFAQRRLVDEAVTFLLTERTNAGALGFVTERSERSQQIDVGGLSMGAVRLLLTERFDFQPPRVLLRRIFESTDGNPLFALELGRALREADHHAGPEQPLALPGALAPLLGQRLAQLSDAARTVALAAALESDLSTGMIEALVGADAAAAVDELITAGIVAIDRDRIRFTHPLLASAVTGAALPQDRHAMQRTLAELVDDPVTSARHLARAVVEPDPDVANFLESAAALARARGGWDAAAELLERARDLTPVRDNDGRQHRGIAAAEHYAHSGDRVRARALVEHLLLEPLPRPHRASALRLLARISADDENFAGAIAVYEEALQYVDDPRVEAAIEDELAYVCASSWDLAAGAHADRALELAEASGDEALKARSLAAHAMVEFMSGHGLDWNDVERALALEDPEVVVPLPMRPSTVAGLLEIYTGRHADARARLTAVWTRAADEGDEGDLPFVLIWLSWLETRSANLATALSLAEQAETYAALTGSTSMRALAVAQRAFVHAYQGDVVRAREGCVEAIALDTNVGFFLPHLWMSASLALLELSLGNAEAAWRACEEMMAPVEAFGIAEPITLFFLPDAIEALVTRGEIDRAAQLASSLEGRGHELDRPWALAIGARCRGLVLAANGDLAGSVAALDQAMTEHDRLDMPFERARTLLAKGVVERRAKQRGRARASLTEAQSMFDTIGARLWAERAQDELARVSGRRAGGTGELTPSEQRVVKLATEGMTNREIADALFMSVHTVETHLSHAYAKLGVRSRSQLPRPPDGDR